MQIRVEKLRDTLRLLQPVIPRKTTLPITTNVLLKDGNAIATDLETAAVLDMPEVEGECLIPHHAVLELLKYVPGDEQLTIESKDGKLRFTWDSGAASYDVANPKDYPPVPEVKWKAEANVDGDALVKTLSAMTVYCAREESRPVLTGVALLLGQNTAVAAGDGFRMAYQDLPLPFPVEQSTIVPAESVHILANFWDKAPAKAPLAGSLISQITAKRQLTLSLGDTSAQNPVMSLRFGRTTLIVKLIEGTPPNFKALIPATSRKVRVMAPELDRAARRLGNIAKDGTGSIRLKWTETAMAVSARSEEMGEAEATIPANAEDGPGRVALNIKYLVEYLKGKDGMVTIGVTDEKSPILFTYRAFPVVLIMPMFVQWDGEQTQPKPEEPTGATATKTETQEEEGDEVLPESIADDGSIAVADAPTSEQSDEGNHEAPQKPKRGRRKKKE